MITERLLVGIDEVGRGPLAGPLVAAAVMLPQPCRLRGLKDSKLLTPLQRQQLAVKIRQRAVSIGIGWQDARAVDQLGLTESTRRAMIQALNTIPLDSQQIVIDGNYNYLRGLRNCQALVKADRWVPCVMAASIIAKVARDSYMKSMAAIFDGYGFEAHVGYGTSSHRQSLLNLGPSPLHRLSFKPLQTV